MGKNIDIIFENNNFIAINKPHGLATQGGSKVKESVDSLFPDKKLTHRLDKDTSGVLLLAKYKNSAARLTKLFQERKIEKGYLAICTPQYKSQKIIHKGRINSPLIKTSNRGREMICTTNHHNKNALKAETYYEILDSTYNTASLIIIKPVTGRKHQVRVHMSAIDLPILGDGKYGGKGAFINECSNKLHLHCYKLEFKYGQQNISITAPLPNHMKETMDFLGLDL